ncbi:MAG: hypothetical protein Q8P37_00160 [Candidatus Spechtbacteria bacterium]|nr:hypothetical protein [Candidatus Spechtbacteria bacterium]
MNPYEFMQILLRICDKKTSADPEYWTPQNPLWGHCAVASLLAQDVFGGDLVRASLEGTPFATMRSHYWNRFPNGMEIDFTAIQFGETIPPRLIPQIRERDYLLSNAETRQRYELLRVRFDSAIGA